MLRGLMAWMLIVLLTPAALAVDFRIETKVYSGDEEVPVSQNTTLFQNGVVYDFVETTSRVSIYRHGMNDQPGRFVLLDPNLSIKTELSTDRMDVAIEKLRGWARLQQHPLLVFSADPNFAESFDTETGELSLVHPQMTYKAATKPVNRSEAWTDLRNYFDAYAKLNCMLGSPTPPTPRLALNKSLENHNVYPTEVTLSIAGNSLTGEGDTELRAEHTFTWRLSKDDRARITLVDEQLVSFRSVSNAEFQRQSVASK
ncbi:hypothetical protein [Aeoliella mucimassa]|uniref:Uncharacterized protein n=1 Tax=Aeoliella mucimassa TaxID=2527972 RepID=A0A518ASM0_9BACT|nr:hypothetical protein [Aeoliella mucimassa]QDU57729.1 hypothetical protein Pan181_39510 [Aeoliella mucimassa]